MGLTDAQVARFQAEGFLLPGLFTALEVEALAGG